MDCRPFAQRLALITLATLGSNLGCGDDDEGGRGEVTSIGGSTGTASGTATETSGATDSAGTDTAVSASAGSGTGTSASGGASTTDASTTATSGTASEPTGTTASATSSEPTTTASATDTSAATSTTDGTASATATMTSATDTSTSAATTATSSDTDTCFEQQFMFESEPTNVLFLLDKSSSMTMTWQDGGQTKRRWESLYNVVDAVTTALDDRVAFGAKLYPSLPNEFGDCGVDPGAEVPLALNNAANLLATLPPPLDALQGSTPTQAGVQQAIAYLDSVYAADPAGTPSQVIVLVADGGIGCDGSATTTRNAIAAAASRAQNPIRTYVVGIDISAFVDDEMNDYAVAGGTALPGATKFYQTTDGDALAAAISAIVGDAQSCQVVLDPLPFGPDLLDVEVGGMSVAQVNDCATDDGWVYVTPGDTSRIELCGSACDALKQSGTVDVDYRCPPAG